MGDWNEVNSYDLKWEDLFMLFMENLPSNSTLGWFRQHAPGMVCER